MQDSRCQNEANLELSVKDFFLICQAVDVRKYYKMDLEATLSNAAQPQPLIRFP